MNSAPSGAAPRRGRCHISLPPMFSSSCLRRAAFFAAQENGERNRQRKPIPRRFPLESFPDGQGRNRVAVSPIGFSFQGNLSEGSPGAPLVTLPALGKSRPRKDRNPASQPQGEASPLRRGSARRRYSFPLARQEARNGPVRRKTAQPCDLRLLTHLGQ